MALNWNFNAAEYEEKDFAPIPIGDYRCRIEEVSEKKSKSGNDMFEIKLSVSGQSSKLWYYIVLDPSNTKMTNQKLGQLWESFGIPSKTMDGSAWVGKIGGCRIKHEVYNGENKAAVHYFHNKKKQESLSAWIEPSNSVVTVGHTTDERPAPTDADAPPFNADDLL